MPKLDNNMTVMYRHGKTSKLHKRSTHPHHKHELQDDTYAKISDECNIRHERHTCKTKKGHHLAFSSTTDDSFYLTPNEHTERATVQTLLS